MDNPSVNHPLIGVGRVGWLDGWADRLVGFHGLDGTPTHKTRKPQQHYVTTTHKWHNYKTETTTQIWFNKKKKNTNLNRFPSNSTIQHQTQTTMLKNIKNPHIFKSEQTFQTQKKTPNLHQIKSSPVSLRLAIPDRNRCGEGEIMRDAARVWVDEVTAARVLVDEVATARVWWSERYNGG